MIDNVAWSTVCAYGGSFSSTDRGVLQQIKRMGHDISYLIFARYVLFANRKVQSVDLNDAAPKLDILHKLNDPIVWISSLKKDRLYRTIQFFPFHHCLAPVNGNGHCCAQEKGHMNSSSMDEDIYDPEFLIYYFLLALRYHPSSVSADQKFLRTFSSYHCLSVLFVMLSSECSYLREGAFQCLDVFSKRIFLLPNVSDENFKEMRLVKWLCMLIQNLFTEQDRREMSSDKAKLAPIIARLFAEYANVLGMDGRKIHSSASSWQQNFPMLLYSDLVKIPISHATLVRNDLPIFTNFWFSTIPENALVKRSFILKILRQGMKNPLDEEVFQKRRIIEHLLVHLLSISSASHLPDMVAILEV